MAGSTRNPWDENYSTEGDSASGAKPWEQSYQEPEKPKPRNLAAVANDTVIEAANAAAGGFSAAANFAKPGNAVSGWIDKNIIQAGEAAQSDVTKAAKQKFRQELDSADGGLNELGAVGRYIVDNPLLTAAQAAGSFAGPGMAVKAAGFAGKAAQLGAKGVERAGRAGGVAAGAAMAGGDAAGTAYELSTKAGAAEDQSVAAGRQASVIPAVIGGVGGMFGAEKLLAGAKGFAGGATSRALKTGASEAVQEGIEEGATQYEGQRAAMPYDPSIDPSKGVAAAAGMGAALGGITGAGASLLTGRDTGQQPTPGTQTPPGQTQPAPDAGPTLALPAPDRGVIQVGQDGEARTPTYQAPGYVGDVTDVEARAIDPVREQVAAAAEQGGALSGAALTAIDSGASSAMQPVAPDAAHPAPISLEEADARDQAAYEQFYASHDADPVVGRYFDDDNDIPDFDAASNVSDEDFLRSLGATDEDIQDAIATSRQPAISQSRPAVDAGPQANEPAGTRQGAGADAAGQEGQVDAGAIQQPAPAAPVPGVGGPVGADGARGAAAAVPDASGIGGTGPGPDAANGAGAAEAGPARAGGRGDGNQALSAPTNLRDALVRLRAQKQEAANAQAAKTPAPAATTVPGTATAAAVEADGVTYAQRNASRVQRVKSASTQAEWDAITNEENNDPERDFSGTDRVKMEINGRRLALKPSTGGFPITQDAQRDQEATDAGMTIVEHTTSKGKVLRGFVRNDMTLDQAKAIDAFAFKKGDGVFIREKYLSQLPPTTTEGTANVPQADQAQQAATQPAQAGAAQAAEPAAGAIGAATAPGAPAVRALSDGISVTPGKGLIKGKFLSSVDGDGTPGGPWATEEDARNAALQWKKTKEARAIEAVADRNRKDAYLQKLRAGHTPSAQEVEGLGLRAAGADLTYFIPLAADLFGITSREVRPLIADLIRVGHTDMGAKRESVNPMKALAQMARAGTNNTQGPTDGTTIENTGAQAAPAPVSQGSAPAAESAEQRTQRVAQAGEAWTRMPTAQREALAGIAAGLNPIQRKRVPSAAWADLNRTIQRNLADAMSTRAEYGQNQAPALDGKAQAATENVATAANQSTYINGDRAEYTGKTDTIHGGLFYEVRFTEGAKNGKTAVTQRAPDGTNPGQRGPVEPTGIVTPQIIHESKPSPVKTTASDVQEPPSRTPESAPSAGAGPATETKPATVVIPQAIGAAFDADMQAQKARITRLRNAAAADGMSLEEKKQAQTQLKGAEFVLQKMRATRFDAEDAALKVIKQKDMAPFADHIAFPRTEKALQELIGSAQAPAPAAAPAKLAPKKKPSADQPSAKTDALAEREKAAKAKMLGALGKLAALASKNTRMNWTPEEEQKLLPIVIELFDGAIELGAVTFQKAVAYVRDFIAQGIDQETADAIPFETLQGAYIAVAGRHKDKGVTAKKEVAGFESLEELQAVVEPAPTPVADTEEKADTDTKDAQNANPDTTTEPGQQPAIAAGPGVQDGKPGKVRGNAGGVRGSNAKSASGNAGRGSNENSGTDYVPGPEGLTRTGSWFETAKRNIDLIELAIKIDAEKRPATPQEQDQLAKYVGFGASAIRNDLFPIPGDYAKRQEPNRLIWPNLVREARWKPLAERIEALPREWQQSILQSSQYAHYTSEGIIRSVWSALDRMGFKGGNVFEPGMGIGSFAMLMPNDVRADSRYTGIEFDGPTALIAGLLSPQQNMIHGDFIQRKFPKNFFDVNVGNPPFAQTKIYGDPDYAKNGFMLHDFFFAKGIDLVRPGGIQVFVTSKGTMDKQSDKARKYLSERADLLGAIRLPSTAFEGNAGTSVVTDVIFLKKRAPGEAPAGHAWAKVATVETPDGPVVVNEYFAANPHMVLGQQRISGNVDDEGRRINSNGQGGEKYTVVSYDKTPAELDAKFAKAIKNLPTGAYTQPAEGQAKEKPKAVDFDPAIKREGVIYLGKDGALMRVDEGVGKNLAGMVNLSEKEQAWFKSYVGLRDKVQAARFDQLNDGPWEKSLAALNKAYDAFRKEHGPIKDFRVMVRKSTDEDGKIIGTESRIFKNRKLYREDYDNALITSLEEITEDGDIVKAPFLQGRTIGKPVERVVRSIGDALAVSLDEIGSLSLDDVGQRLGLSREEAIEALGAQVYQAPTGEWQLADEYLSGDVVAKLEEAEQAVRLQPELRRNIQALKDVQPEKLGPSQISAKLGASWIPASHVNEFAAEIGAGAVTFDPRTETWQVDGGNLRSQRTAGDEYGTAARSPSELLEAVLNSRSIKVTKSVDKKTVTDEAATTAANEVAKKIKDKFKGWVWTDTDRSTELVEGYNKQFNNIAPRRFDGSHLTLPGVSLRFKLHPHQLRAIWRMVQTGNTYLAHAVGAGKTIEMIAGGMEQKRLGLIKKPIYVVPNHMLEQFSNEFMELYPMANIMVADDENFSPERRKAFVAAATLNNPDAIVITHDAFQRIGVKEESVAPIRDEILADLEIELSETAKSNDTRVRRGQLEQQIEAVKQRFDRIIGAGAKDSTVKFEDMGVDFVFADEAHVFRKLDFHTAQQIKGIDPNGSKRALDMYVKTRILDGRNPGRSMVFASGTPVTNTMGELYTIMRFFGSKELDKGGISTFDAWARQFGEVAPALEPNAAGKYELIERFAKFDNVPELMSRVRQFMDVLTSDNLGALVKRPDIKGGKPNLNITAANKALQAYMKGDLAQRIEASKAWKPSKDEPNNPDPIVAIITDGRFAALDPRFFGGKLEEGETSLLMDMGKGVVESYHATKENVYKDKAGNDEPIKGSTQLVFYNLGFGEQSQKNRGFNSRAAFTKILTDGGIPRGEIYWFDDANTDAKKEAVFKDVRNGKVKVLIGSAKKMGTGVNVQKRLAVLHYQDPPWFPADVEQPHGRIIRQGNQNAEGAIEWYTTKGTYQSTMWQMVARKQRFIDQAFSGDKNLRSMDDMGEASLFEQAAAVASGDPRAIQLAGLRQDVQRFERLQAAHASEQIEVASSLRSAEWGIDSAKKRIATYTKAFTAIGEKYFSFSAGNVGGATYTKPGEFGQALKDAFNKTAADAVMAENPVEDKAIATIGDAITIYMDQLVDSKGVPEPTFNLSVSFGGMTLSMGNANGMGADVDAAGLARRIFNQINSVDQDLRRAKDDLARNEVDFNKLRKKKGAPFEYQQEMAEKYAELKRLEAELKAEGEAPTAPVAPAIMTDDALTPQAEGESTNRMQTGAPEANTADVVYSSADSTLPAKPLTLDRVNQLVQEALAGIRGAPPVDVVGRPADVGLQVPAGSVGYGVTLRSGDIYVFQSAMGSDLDVFRTVFHELFHRGVRVLVPKAQYVQTMLDLAKGDSRIQQLAIEWKNTEMGQKQKDNLRQQGYTGAELTGQYEALAIEEALAAVAEEIKAEGKLGSKPKSMTIRFLANWLAKVADLAGMKKLAQGIRTMTYNEAERFVMSAISRSGEPVQAGRTDNMSAKQATPGAVNTMTENEARKQGFTLKAYRGISKSNPFNDSGTTWLTTSREVAEAYAEEVMGYDDPDVLEVMVKPDGLPRHDASRLTDEQREAFGADEFGNPQSMGIYDRSDDHPLGGSRGNVTVIHAPREAVVVLGSNAPAGDQTQTEAFKRWFGASKVVDADGKPLVVYHGSTSGGISNATVQNTFFTPNRDVASSYALDESASRSEGQLVVNPVYIRIENPLVVDAYGAPWMAIPFEGGRMTTDGIAAIAKSRGHDGVLIKNVEDNVNDEELPPADIYITLGKRGQIKSATGNNGAFDPASADIRFRSADLGSRAGMAGLASKARDELNKTFGAPGKLSFWHKSVGTMYNLAERSPAFKPVFNAAQGFVDDVSYYATDAAELAPKLLPKLETWRDIAKRPITAADNAAVAKPVFEGTLDWARDESGKPVRLQTLLDAADKLTPEQKAQRLLRNNKISEGMLKAWQGLPLEQYEKLVASRYESQMLQAGIVWTPDELKSQFKLTDAQVELYQEFRAATNRSLDTMARSDMLRFGGEDVKDLADMVMDAKDAQDAAQILRDHLLTLAKENPDRAGAIGQLANGMLDRAARVQELQEQGYAPLSRFGKYTVDVVDANGKREYFGLFETAREANIMAMKMRKGYGQDAVTQGTLSDEEFKLLAGITPESLELFGNMLGLDATGDDAQDQAFQEYLRRTKTNRSAMRRLIHRQGIAGYSEDVGRVLASFIYSNSRQTSAGLHMGDLGEAITQIPKQQGELKDAAIQMAEYVKNPREEAQMVRGLLFAQYLGGSIASAMVNMSQPVAVTFPWLSQFGGAKQAAAELGRAAKNLASRGHRFEADLAAALKHAEEEGTVSPQEVHQLQAQAQGSGSLRPGDGTRTGEARAAASNALTRLSLAWGKVFGAAEQVNRRMTFIAAYRVAKAQKMANPAAFAKKAVIETQFTYSKANKMKWGRGAVGATAMTFKTYSVAYLELLGRMWTQGGPEGKKAVLLALGMLMLMGGAGGLPFAEDAEDLADGLAQMMGYNINSKKAKQELLESIFGEAGAGFVERGITGLPGMPLDVSGRLGMGNLLPATGLFKEKTDHTRDVLEIVGPVGDLAKRAVSGARSILTGDVGAGLLQMAPAAVRNAAKGADMASTGMYRDDKGYKVLDTSPTEAAMKFIGFQPASVSKVQESNFINQQAKNFYNLQAQEIRAKWARGIFEKNTELVAEARTDLEDWNRRNPDQRIVVSMPAVLKRVREMGKSKDERIAATAPKAMRQQMREDAAKARAAL